jgi:Tol biopolymer transport system component
MKSFLGAIAVLAAATGSIRAQAIGPAEKPNLVLEAGGHTGAIRGLAFTPDGKELVSSSWDRTIRFWNVKTGELNRIIRLPMHTGGPMALAPDGHTVALHRKFSETEFGVALITLPEDGTIRNLKGLSVPLSSLAFSPDGRQLAVGEGSSPKSASPVHVFDVATGRRDKVLTGHTATVEGLAFSPDGRRLASVSFDLTARIWNLATGKTEAVMEDRTLTTAWNGIAWSPDGQTLATGCFGNLLRIWNANGTLRERHNTVRTYRSMVFTKDSKALLFAAPKGGYLFDLTRKQVRAACQEVRNEVWVVALSPDETLAAVGGNFGEDLYLWNTKDGSVAHRLAGAGRGPMGAAWSPDGKSIAWGASGEEFEWGAPGVLHRRHPLERSFDWSELQFGARPAADWKGPLPTSGTLSVAMNFYKGGTGGWVDVKDQEKVLATIKQNWSKAATFLPGERLAIAGNGFKLYQARTGQLLRTFDGGALHSIAPSPDFRYLLAPRGDQTLVVWKIDQNERLLSFYFAGDDWIAWTPEGYYAASPGGERLMGWQIDNDLGHLPNYYPAAHFRKALYRPDVIKRVLQTGSVQKALQMANAERGKDEKLREVAEVLPPQVRIMSPDKARTVRDASLEVRARATSTGAYPVTAMQLMLDGRPLSAGGGVFRAAPPKLGDVEASWSVALSPGKHRIAVRADSAVSSAHSEEIEVNYVVLDAAEQSRRPTLYVLAIGISDYPGDLKLNYAANDAGAVANAFRSHSNDLYEKIVIKELTDKKATQREIMQGISWLKKQPTQRDVAVLFFAGHGDLSSDGSMYLLPSDVDPKDLEATGVPADQLKNLLTGFPCRVVFMLDACHSGGIGSKTTVRSGKSLTDDLIRDLVTDERGVIVLCASTGRQFALESNEHRHGLFTLALVEGLQGKAMKTTDGAIYLHHLDAYVTDRVKQLSQGRQSPTTVRPASVRSFPLSRP